MYYPPFVDKVDTNQIDKNVQTHHWAYRHKAIDYITNSNVTLVELYNYLDSSNVDKMKLTFVKSQ